MVEVSDWTYYKKINLNGETGAGTHYQIELNIGESSGSTTNNFHVEGHSEDFPSAKNDGGDLIFLANDQSTQLSFWVESVTGTTPNRVAKVWVKVSDDLSTDKSIYCYYGNASATNLSSGEDTFIFFDDFDDATLNTTKWYYSGISTTLTSSKVAVGASSKGGHQLESKTAFGINTKIKTNAYFARTTLSYHYIGYNPTINASSYNNRMAFESRWESDPQINSHIYNGTGYDYDTLLDMDSSGYGYTTWMIKRNNNGSNKFYINESLKNNVTDKYITIDIPFGANTYDFNKITYIDWVFVAKNNDTEPSVDTVGSETENEPPVKLGIKIYNGTNFDKRTPVVYINGAWVTRPIKVYKNSAWIDVY